jgi:SAM-dependent methyltransferase
MNKEQLMVDIYKASPLSISNDIPIFTPEDPYVKNYGNIARDHIAAITAESQNPFIEDELWQKMEESTRQLIRSHSKDGDLILDVGVGLGRLLSPFDNLQKYGIDISIDYLQIAKQNDIKVAFAKIEDMPYLSNSFDIVTVCDVLEHVFDLNTCCNEILRVLKPGGTLIVRVPFKEDLTVYLNEDLPYEFIHLRAFDEPSLRLMFEKIYRLSFVETLFTVPYLQGSPRLKIQLLTNSETNDLRQFLSGFSFFSKEKKLLQILRNIDRVSSEELLMWIQEVQKNNPELYSAMQDKLVLPIEINCVFKK